MRSLLWLCLCACAAKTAEAPPPREIEKLVHEPVEEPAPSPAPLVGVIPRRELLAILDRSPGWFLQRVEVTPRFSQGRFFGWRIGRFFPDDARFADVDVRAGDVVLRVNGRSVEKPDQLMEVWQSLRTATSLEVEIERNSAQRTLRWPIQ